MALTQREIAHLNKMNRAAQDPQLGTLLASLETSINENISGSVITYNKVNVSVANSPYALVESDFTLRCNASGGSIVVNLIPAVGSGNIYNIKNLYTSTCVVEAVANTSGTPDLIDGETSQIIPVKSNMQIQDGAINHWDIL